MPNELKEVKVVEGDAISEFTSAINDIRSDALNATAEAQAIANKLTRSINILSETNDSITLFAVGQIDAVQIEDSTSPLGDETLETVKLTYPEQ